MLYKKFLVVDILKYFMDNNIENFIMSKMIKKKNMDKDKIEKFIKIFKLKKIFENQRSIIVEI